MSLEADQLFNFESQLRMEVARILADPVFRRAPIQARLLAYLRDTTLSSKPAPSQYQLAVDGLGRSEDYDVSSDSYPRVQMSRLRKNLENYYARNLPANGFKVIVDPDHYALDLTRVVQDNPELATEKSPSGKIELVAILFVLVLTFVLAAKSLFDVYSAEQAKLEKPSVKLIIDDTALARYSDKDRAFVTNAQRLARLQLQNSFVSKFAPAGSDNEAEYTLNIDFGEAAYGQISASALLLDSSGEVLFSDDFRFPVDDFEAFLQELEGGLVYIASPTGVIARRELTDFNSEPNSGYSCFLLIESQRSRGQATSDLLDQCIEKYPESEYQPFWLARRSYQQYQSQIAQGSVVEKKGPPWRDLQAALDLDRYNPFASFVAAKLELAEGDCTRANLFIERALEKGGSYPVLVAAMEAEASNCAADDTGATDRIEKVKVIAAANPNPDPLLHVYLMIAMLSVGDRGEAEEIARQLVIENPQGPVDQTSNLLRSALLDVDFARRKEKEISNSLRLFIWNDASRERVVQRLKQTAS